MHLNVIQVTST
uniref:Uncharacterized protein n=1 Tax=Rhizophora mucronata TaxID=61149 RepID=A0A2P2N6I0_RHIMU